VTLVIETIVLGAVGSLVAAGLIAVGARLRKRPNRERLAERARQVTCRHQWEPINTPGDSVVLVSADEDWCTRCGKRR
jgi:hypothetical protein